MLDRPQPEIHEPVRPLGSLEQMLWLADQNHPTHFALTALGRRPRADDRLALGPDRVQARHPLLAVHVDAAPGREPLFCRVDGRPIPLRILWGNPETLWKQQVAEELATPFNHAEAPLVRAVLIQGLNGVALILVAQHAHRRRPVAGLPAARHPAHHGRGSPAAAARAAFPRTRSSASPARR
ncbi:MAG: hypothetical protein WDO13_20985 [Verrucomicrobiota bacterium]